MEITNSGNECPPFSKCWCEKHPNGDNHPNCQVELTLGNVYLDLFLIVSICVLIFTKIRRGRVL